MFSKRLNLLRNSIKAEPIDIFENNDEIRSSSNVNDQELQKTPRDPRVKTSNSTIYEPLRNQFLNKTLSAQNIIDNLEISGGQIKQSGDKRIDATFNRARNINDNLMEPRQNLQFYAHAPANPIDTANSLNYSPFVQNECNALFSFQATPENVNNVMIESNPYTEIPYRVQSIGQLIGADMEKLKQKLRTESKKRQRTVPSNESANLKKAEDEHSELLRDSATNSRVVKEVFDKGVQTTINTGDLRFEITSGELENLSEEKKVILLQFMKAFDIRDSKNISAIKERLQHRLANRVPKRQQSRSFGPPL